jgi:hypothetical protein
MGRTWGKNTGKTIFIVHIILVEEEERNLLNVYPLQPVLRMQATTFLNKYTLGTSAVT